MAISRAEFYFLLYKGEHKFTDVIFKQEHLLGMLYGERFTFFAVTDESKEVAQIRMPYGPILPLGQVRGLTAAVKAKEKFLRWLNAWERERDNYDFS